MKRETILIGLFAVILLFACDVQIKQTPFSHDRRKILNMIAEDAASTRRMGMEKHNVFKKTNPIDKLIWWDDAAAYERGWNSVTPSN